MEAQAPLSQTAEGLGALVITHAKLAIIISRVGQLASNAQADLARGMHNPNFCSADCSTWAASLCEDLRANIAWIEKEMSK